METVRPKRRNTLEGNFCKSSMHSMDYGDIRKLQVALVARTYIVREYTSRYEKIHSAQNLIENILCGLPRRIPSGELTPFAQAMPDIYKDEHDAVNAYRNYYNGTKTRFAKWKNGKVPHWFRSETLTA